MSPLHSLLLLAFSCLLPTVHLQGFKHFPVVAGGGPPPPQRPPSSSRTIAPPPPPSRPASVPQRAVSQEQDDSSSVKKRVKNLNRGRGRGRTNTRTRGEDIRREKQPSAVTSQTRIRPRPTQPPQQRQEEEQETARLQPIFQESNPNPPIRTRVQAFRDQSIESFDKVEKSKPRIRLPQSSEQIIKAEPVKTKSTLRDSLSSVFSVQSNANSINDDRFIPDQPRFAAAPSPGPQFTSNVAQTAPTRILTPTSPTPKPVFIFHPSLQTNELNSFPEQVEPQVSGQQDITQFSQIQQQPISPQFARPAPAVPQREPARVIQTPRPQPPKLQIQQQPISPQFARPAPAVTQREPARVTQTPRPQPPKLQIQQRPISSQFARPAPALPQREPARVRQTPLAQPPKLQIQEHIPVQHRFAQAAPVEDLPPFNPTSLFSQEIKAPEGADGDGVYFSYEATLGGRRR